ncbi:MAG: response regulator [Candidatus Omnitrophica bacterium]|nr:response regulator [Candidatus Omnitrophota bacterium]
MEILVVDDEDIVRDVLKRFFYLKGVKAEAVESGSLALERIKEKEFDLIFLDIKMPKMDGFEVLREAKKIRPNSRFVMMTGYASDDFEKEAQKEGAVAFITKPFDLQQLIALIDRFRPQEK